jgi:hypothetical protein
MDLGAKRTANEEKDPPGPMPSGMANPNLGNLESEVGGQKIACNDCGTEMTRDVHEAEGGLCYDCWKDQQDRDENRHDY